MKLNETVYVAIHPDGAIVNGYEGYAIDESLDRVKEIANQYCKEKPKRFIEVKIVEVADA